MAFPPARASQAARLTQHAHRNAYVQPGFHPIWTLLSLLSGTAPA
ncbi:MAG TPA: hypothetical protein VJR87_01955 [Allosphingosinicella sp.]|nr:hypothetical protein [Allosphingosinicella sp.]